MKIKLYNTGNTDFVATFYKGTVQPGIYEKTSSAREISGSHGGEYEVQSLRTSQKTLNFSFSTVSLEFITKMIPGSQISAGLTQYLLCELFRRSNYRVPQISTVPWVLRIVHVDGARLCL
jgi:hypothetical protein